MLQNLLTKEILDKIYKKFGSIEDKPFTNIQQVNLFVKNNLDIFICFNKILNEYPNLNNYNNVLCLIRYKLDPNEVLFCKICHKPLKLKFGLLNKCKSQFCSVKCAANNPDTIKKRANTNIKLYGRGFCNGLTNIT